MIRSDWKKFLKLIEGADELTVGKPRSENALGLMFKSLSNYALLDIAEAITTYLNAGSKFAVTVGDIIRIISGDPEEQAAIAWRIFLVAMERNGYYDSVRFPHPAFHRVIRQFGGWVRICEEWHLLDEQDLHFRAKEWRQLYCVALRDATWENEAPYLPGRYEVDNLSGGYLDFIPSVIDVETNMTVERSAIGASAELIELEARYVKSKESCDRLFAGQDRIAQLTPQRELVESVETARRYKDYREIREGENMAGGSDPVDSTEQTQCTGTYGVRELLAGFVDQIKSKNGL